MPGRRSQSERPANQGVVVQPSGDARAGYPSEADSDPESRHGRSRYRSGGFRSFSRYAATQLARPISPPT